MPWSKALYEQGATDGISVAKVDGFDIALNMMHGMSGGEYEAGFAKGVRRVMIDRRQYVDCAMFILNTEVEFTLRVKVKTALDADEMRWVIDPQVDKVVGLFRGDECMMVLYLEDADFEESLSLLEWADAR